MPDPRWKRERNRGQGRAGGALPCSPSVHRYTHIQTHGCFTHKLEGAGGVLSRFRLFFLVCWSPPAVISHLLLLLSAPSPFPFLSGSVSRLHPLSITSAPPLSPEVTEGKARRRRLGESIVSGCFVRFSARVKVSPLPALCRGAALLCVSTFLTCRGAFHTPGLRCAAAFLVIGVGPG